MVVFVGMQQATALELKLALVEHDARVLARRTAAFLMAGAFFFMLYQPLVDRRHFMLVQLTNHLGYMFW